jgi:hypothetical protein
LTLHIRGRCPGAARAARPSRPPTEESAREEIPARVGRNVRLLRPLPAPH